MKRSAGNLRPAATRRSQAPTLCISGGLQLKLSRGGLMSLAFAPYDLRSFCCSPCSRRAVLAEMARIWWHCRSVQDRTSSGGRGSTAVEQEPRPDLLGIRICHLEETNRDFRSFFVWGARVKTGCNMLI